MTKHSFAESVSVAAEHMFQAPNYLKVLMLMQNHVLTIELCKLDPDLTKQAVILIFQLQGKPFSLEALQRMLVALLEELDDNNGTLTKLALEQMFGTSASFRISCSKSLTLDDFKLVRSFILCSYPHLLARIQAKRGRPNLALQTFERVLRINKSRRERPSTLPSDITDPWVNRKSEILLDRKVVPLLTLDFQEAGRAVLQNP